MSYPILNTTSDTLWSKTGTVLSPLTAGDSINTTAHYELGGTKIIRDATLAGDAFKSLGVGFNTLDNYSVTGNSGGNFGFGDQALRDLTEGRFNTAIGVKAGAGATVRNGMIAIGFEAQLSGGAGIAIGDRAMRQYTGGTPSIGIGNLTGQSFTGSESVMIGGSIKVTGAHFNTVVGYGAFDNATTSFHTVALGRDALRDVVTSGYNVAIGSNTGNTVTGASNVLIGYSVASGQTAISNELWIDNSNTTTPLIHGDFSTNNEKVTINGRLNVTDNTDTAVAGDIRYNTSTNKHQGYNGTTWNDMY